MNRGVNGGNPLPQGHALLLGMPDGYFQHQLWGDLEEFRVITIGLKQERQHIKAASWGFPALLYTDLQTETFSYMSVPAPLNTAHSRHRGGGCVSTGLHASPPEASQSRVVLQKTRASFTTSV